MVRVDDHEQRVSDDMVALLIELLDHVAGHPHPEGAHKVRCPGLIVHFLTGGVQKGDVFDVLPAEGAALKKSAALERGLASANLDYTLAEFKKRLLIGSEVPVHPADLIVLTIGVVISLL